MNKIVIALLSVAMLFGFAAPAHSAPVGQVRTYTENCRPTPSTEFAATVTVKQVTPNTIQVIRVYNRGKVIDGPPSSIPQHYGAMDFRRRTDNARMHYQPFVYVTFGKMFRGPDAAPKKVVRTAGGLEIRVRASYIHDHPIWADREFKCTMVFKLSSSR